MLRANEFAQLPATVWSTSNTSPMAGAGNVWPSQAKHQLRHLRPATFWWHGNEDILHQQQHLGKDRYIDETDWPSDISLHTSSPATLPSQSAVVAYRQLLELAKLRLPRSWHQRDAYAALPVAARQP